MKISAIRSDKVYSKIMNAPLDKKNDIYRYELMKPFEKKWACYSVPMKALTPNGFLISIQGSKTAVLNSLTGQKCVQDFLPSQLTCYKLCAFFLDFDSMKFNGQDIL